LRQMGINEMAACVGDTYAQALFDLAGQGNVVDAVKADIDVLSDICEHERDFIKLMASPYFSVDTKKALVSKVFSGRLNELTMNFLMVVTKNTRMRFLLPMLCRYGHLWEGYHGYCNVDVTISHQLFSDEVKKLTDEIASAVNKKVKLDVRVNPSILGGIIISYGGKHIDNTVNSRLISIVKTITSRNLGQEED
jgi:F-type H+-transporting ATPase subunit delta